MFHETNSINTFYQPSCKMLNCSKHKNQIKICFHNWTQAFSPIISWQLYKSWWNTSMGKTQLWLGHWGPGTNTSTRACGKGAQILQPVPTPLTRSPATHTLPTILYGVNTFAQTNGRRQGTIQVSSLNTSGLILQPSAYLSFPETHREKTKEPIAAAHQSGTLRVLFV